MGASAGKDEWHLTLAMRRAPRRLYHRKQVRRLHCMLDRVSYVVPAEIASHSSGPHWASLHRLCSRSCFSDCGTKSMLRIVPGTIGVSLGPAESLYLRLRSAHVRTRHGSDDSGGLHGGSYAVTGTILVLPGQHAGERRTNANDG